MGGCGRGEADTVLKGRSLDGLPSGNNATPPPRPGAEVLVVVGGGGGGDGGLVEVGGGAGMGTSLADLVVDGGGGGGVVVRGGGGGGGARVLVLGARETASGNSTLPLLFGVGEWVEGGVGVGTTTTLGRREAHNQEWKG
ncbi:hypothetical protein Pcinc_026858 [Petrolisthes cinctipes]|uniref:Uncharacterized protein n=1 Tax=Petrolisthes cinctipes TaxID=88211 RepID=A0AAE1K7K0_PETCI|nr:hypothetical protein Pcinc_026858 [Petrolisthes cinctipes]